MKENYGKTIVHLLQQIETSFSKNMRQYTTELTNFGLTFPQMSVLLLLHQHGSLRISDISLQLGMTNSTVSGIIDRLERMDLVQRARNQLDRRVVKVSLTQKTHDISQHMDEKLEQYFAELFKKTPPDDLTAIVNGLEKLNKIISSIPRSCEPE